MPTWRGGSPRTAGSASATPTGSVEALSSCAGAEVQAPPHVKRLLRDVCTRVGAWCARVLREASRSVATMTTSSSRALDFAVTDMNTAVQELQGDLRTLPSMLAVKLAETSSLMDTMPVFTVASLLVEISARVEGVVDAVDELATLAGFKQVDDDDNDKKGETEMKIKVHPLNEPDTDEESPENKTSKA